MLGLKLFFGKLSSRTSVSTPCCACVCLCTELPWWHQWEKHYDTGIELSSCGQNIITDWQTLLRWNQAIMKSSLLDIWTLFAFQAVHFRQTNPVSSANDDTVLNHMGLVDITGIHSKIKIKFDQIKFIHALWMTIDIQGRVLASFGFSSRNTIKWRIYSASFK